MSSTRRKINFVLKFKSNIFSTILCTLGSYFTINNKVI